MRATPSLLAAIAAVAAVTLALRGRGSAGGLGPAAVRCGGAG